MVQAFNEIHTFAKQKNYKAVRQMLSKHLFTYRQAQLYCEKIKNDYSSAKYILKQATCKCGTIVNTWHRGQTPTCGNCHFQKEVNNKIDW